MDFLTGTINGALAGATACFAVLWLDRRGAKPAPPAPAQAPAAPPAAPTAPDSLALILPALLKSLSPLAEEISHPAELPPMAEFQAVVAALRRPDATFAQLRQHALGANWPLACAAFIVLAEHPERQTLAEPVVRHIKSIRPFVLMFALEFLAGLPERPPVGAGLIGIYAWWADNIVIPGFLEDYFTRRAALGDQPSFGPPFARTAELATAPTKTLLEKVTHPFAAVLLAQLRAWEATRIDKKFLEPIGQLWDPKERDGLLVAPPAWAEPLALAEAAISQARPRSVLVSGGPRTGKTAFITLLCQRLQDQGLMVFSAAANELQAGQSYIGQLEGRIRQLIEALHKNRKIIWHLRDLSQAARSGTHSGQSATILDQILPAMVAGNLIVVAEAGQSEAARLFQSRPALRATLEVLTLTPLNEPAARDLAHEVAARLARQTSVGVPRPAVAAALELANAYLGTAQSPGAVLELLKQAATRAANAKEGAISAASVLTTLAQMSGLPRAILDTSERLDLTAIRTYFAARLIGQDEAVRAITERITMLKAGLTDPLRPIGVFMFAGPTGTGKTELAKTLAAYLFGAPERMTRLDMSEFQSAEATSKIIGQRGFTESDSLIERIRKQPFSVVLLDEFEKAHPSCWDLFLQLFDDGRLTDANGQEADFRHAFIILTTNLGATAHRGSGLGFRPEAGRFSDEQVVRAIAQTFRPEFVNRLDKIIVFKPLSRALMRGILHKELGLVLARRGFREHSWAVEWEASAIEFLLDRGFSAEMGARPLKRAIDQLLLAPLAQTLVEHRFPQGDQFLFVRSDGRKIEVEFVDPDAGPAPAAPPEPEPEDDRPLGAIVLRQTGSPAERATLARLWREIEREIASAAWDAAGEALRRELAEPSFWSRPDRHRVFSAIERRDRVREAARTAERLFQRYEAAGAGQARASRELAARLALQLHNIREGMADIAQGAPVDALLRVEPAMESGADPVQGAAWCARLTGMYREWAAKRRMQSEALAGGPDAAPILLVSGFGAHRTLRAEAGLHIFEYPDGAVTRRATARVVVEAGPEQDWPKPESFARAAALLSGAPAATHIVRRYREEPAPLVRDTKGWRTGRLDAVLTGDFDLIAAAAG